MKTVTYADCAASADTRAMIERLEAISVARAVDGSHRAANRWADAARAILDAERADREHARDVRRLTERK